jgi:hypothetical protein
MSDVGQGMVAGMGLYWVVTWPIWRRGWRVLNQTLDEWANL